MYSPLRLPRPELGLLQKFLYISLLFILPGAVLVGIWTATRIEAFVMKDLGLHAGIHLDAVMALRRPDRGLPPGSAVERALMAFEARSAGAHMSAERLWAPDGRVIFAADPTQTDRRLNIGHGMAEALAGRIGVQPGGADLPGSPPTIRAFVPVRDDVTGAVVAVAEFAQDATSAMSLLSWSRSRTWLIVGLAMAAMFGALYPVIARGQSQITRQRLDLDDRLRELTRLHRSNALLQMRLDRARTRQVDVEPHLRRIGADIHDGVGQLLAIALLKIDQLFPDGARNADQRAIRDMLEDAMAEIRAMVGQLMLPHLKSMSLTTAVETMVAKHRHRTSTDVDLWIEPDLGPVDDAVKVAVCRFVQEGLNNAFKHAHGCGQSVVLTTSEACLLVTVSDLGPGFDPQDSPGLHGGMGLVGLRDRVESVGGAFVISSTPGAGTVLSGRFPMTGEA